jgi:GAF domain-containing protein
MKTEKSIGRRNHRQTTNEIDRVKLVNSLKHMHFDLNTGLQGIVKLAAEICDTPFAQVTLLDETNQYSMARKGIDQCITNRELSFCTHTIKQYDVMVVEDTVVDKRFLSNPFVTDGPKIRFYAGAPLTTKEDLNLGALCVLDICPKAFGEDKKQMLKILAEQALYLMELQRSVELLKKQFADIEKQNNALSKIAFMQSHEFRLPVANILGLMNLIKDEGYAKSEQYFLLMEDVVRSLDEKIHIVVASTAIARDAHIA